MDNDCLFCIFQLLDANHFMILAKVSKQFNFVTNNELLWKTVFNNNFEIDIKMDYKNKYKDYAILNRFLLQTLGKNVNKNYYLTYIDFGYKKIKFIPKEFGLLTNLLKLSLNGTQLKTIPK